MLVDREFLFVLARCMFDVAGVYRLITLLVNKASSRLIANKGIVFFLFRSVLTILLDNDSSALATNGECVFFLLQTLAVVSSLAANAIDKKGLMNESLVSRISNTQSLLLQELARAADSHNIKDQLSVLFEREVVEDRQNMQNYYRLSNKLNEVVRMRDRYINEP
ncbi:hypothetical protein Tco_1063871 [Tanacetum coccineum]